MLAEGPDGRLTGYVYVVVRTPAGAAPQRVAIRGSRAEARAWLDARDADPAFQRECRIRRARLTVF